MCIQFIIMYHHMRKRQNVSYMFQIFEYWLCFKYLKPIADNSYYKYSISITYLFIVRVNPGWYHMNNLCWTALFEFGKLNWFSLFLIRWCRSSWRLYTSGFVRNEFWIVDDAVVAHSWRRRQRVRVQISRTYTRSNWRSSADLFVAFSTMLFSLCIMLAEYMYST